MSIRIILVFLSVFFLNVSFQIHRENFITVVDKDTKKHIPFSAIIFVNQNIARNTEKNGKLVIPESIDDNDILMVLAQGYQVFKAKVAEVKKKQIIELLKAPEPAQVNVSTKSLKETIVLNKYDTKKVFYFTGLEKPFEPFNYLQMAQKFTTPKKGCMLTSVTIRRLILSEQHLEPREGLAKVAQVTFRLRVYNVDLKTAGPGSDLHTKEILVDNESSDEVKIDLSPYKIFVPGDSFFIAIEWLRILPNAQTAAAEADGSISIIHKMKVDRLKFIYQPFLGTSNIKGNNLNTWALNFQNQWLKYEYFSPYITDFAISSTVRY